MLDFDFLAGVAREAGKAILEVYGTDFEIKCKDDRSPSHSPTCARTG